MSLALRLALCLLWTVGAAHAQEGRPPVIDEGALARASIVVAMADDDPVDRLNLMLASKDLDSAAQFVIASTHPSIVEQLYDPRYRIAVDYITALPPHDLGRVRRGETVIRTADDLRGTERQRAEALATHFGFDPEKISAMRVGPLEGRILRVEITVKKNKKVSFTDAIELGWPSTPDRDEASRSNLARYFGGARPSRVTTTGSVFVQDRSFEAPDTLGKAWLLRDGVMLGTSSPVQEVVVDDRVSLDGGASLRFNATKATRLFPEVYQQTAVLPGSRLRARVHVKAENLRVEFLQKEGTVRIALQYIDAGGAPIGRPEQATSRLSSHPWEVIEIESLVPPSAAAVQVGLLCGVSGTAWFDGLTLEAL